MKEEIKIALVTNFPLPYTGIGSWTTMMNYHLSHDNNIDYVLSPKSEAKLEGATPITISSPGLLKKLYYKLGFGSKLNGYINAISRLLSVENYLIIQVVDNYGILINLLKFIEKNNLRKRVYIQYFHHGFSTFTKSAKMISQIDELILLSESSYKSFKRDCVELPVKITINPNGVEATKFFPVSGSEKNMLRKKHQIDEDKMIFVWCSQDREKKGLDIIIQAWKKLVKDYSDAIELLIIGTHKEIPVKNVKVIGRVANDQLGKYYQLSDFFLFSTLCHEGFGLALVEALKSGIYCIASDNGSVSEVLNHGQYGILVANPNNVESWVATIKTEIEKYSASHRTNPYLKNIPKDLYAMESWHNRTNKIAVEARENFFNRYYI